MSFLFFLKRPCDTREDTVDWTCSFCRGFFLGTMYRVLQRMLSHTKICVTSCEFQVVSGEEDNSGVSGYSAMSRLDQTGEIPVCIEEKPHFTNKSKSLTKKYKSHNEKTILQFVRKANSSNQKVCNVHAFRLTLYISCSMISDCLSEKHSHFYYLHFTQHHSHYHILTRSIYYEFLRKHKIECHFKVSYKWVYTCYRNPLTCRTISKLTTANA